MKTSHLKDLTQLVYLLSKRNPLSEMISFYSSSAYVKLGRGIVAIRGKLLIDRINNTEHEGEDIEMSGAFFRKYLKFLNLNETLAIITDPPDKQKEKAIKLIRSYDPDSQYVSRIFYFNEQSPDSSFSVVKEFPLFLR